MAVNGELLFGVAAPQIHAQLPLNLGDIQTYVRRAEELNFHSLWAQEQLVLRRAASALEPITILSYAAALTQTLRLGMAVFLINLRSPIVLAKSLASLDQLSQGRLIVGVGLGAVTRLYRAYGLSAERRVARFLEALALMQKLWTEEEVNFDGQFWKLTRATLVPKPVQRPHPPIWFGANAPAALKRAVRRGSGFIGAGSTSTEDFKAQVRTVLEALKAEKKEPAGFTIGKRVYLAVDRDRERALKRLREWFGAYYGRADMADQVAVWGSAGECVLQLKEIIHAGARLLLFNPVFDMREQLEIIAAEVLPALSRQ